MTKHDCDVCQGRGLVRLPIYRPLKVTAIDIAPEPVESSRQYPCPECGDAVSIGHVGALREESFVASYINEPGFIEHVKEGLAHLLAGQLLKDGYIKFRRGPTDSQEMRFQMVATVGVVHPSKLDTLEQRIAERQDVVAREVANEAVRQIDNFGSYYGHADILKQTARHLIEESLQTILKRRAHR